MLQQAPWVPASELKKAYDVLGHFYELPDDPCGYRSVLEIKARECTNLLSGPNMERPDAVFVMMNPGSSRPLHDQPEVIAQVGDLYRPKRLVPTKPDTTQYQLMRVMRRLDFNYVRVINLSDVRISRSEDFYRYVKTQVSKCSWNHSIFSCDRTSELEVALERKDGARLACAWGVSDKLNDLILKAHKAIKGLGCIGVSHHRGTNKYLHPLQRPTSAQIDWVEKMIKSFKSPLA